MAKLKDYHKITGYSAKTLLGNDITNGPLNKIWRAKILYNRTTSGMILSNPDLDIPNPKTKNTIRTKADRDWVTKKNREQSSDKDRRLQEPSTTFKKNMYEDPFTRETKVNNQIVLANISSNPATLLYIQGMPKEVDVSSENTWAAVKSMGRNNPFYMFTGSEDTISFEISWYAVQQDRQDVINKCKLLESWCKADGYLKSPPLLSIMWGSSDLFKDEFFILYSAPYRLSNFQNAYAKVSKDPSSNISKGYSNYYTRTKEVIDLKLYPNVATQQLVFKKVTGNNLTHELILPKAKMNKTKGIGALIKDSSTHDLRNSTL